MSVTSSGRSPMRATIKCTSGYLVEMELAICLRMVVLPAFGGETIRPRWPRPIGAIKVDQTRGQGIVVDFKVKAFIGKDGGEVLKSGTAGGFLGVQAVDRFYF